MVKIDIPQNLYEDFLKEKENLDSTLSTIEILKDKNFVNEINKGLKELKEGKSSKLNFNEIDNL